jgi:PKD repeat protein
MANTGGFEVVAEISKATVDQILLAARKSNVIPQGFTESSPIAFGSYLTDEIEVVVPEAGLEAELLPATNSVRVHIPVQIDVSIQNPPVPSTALFNMTADLHVDAPLGTLPSEAPKIGVLTQNIGRGQVGASLTSGDPIPPITESVIAEYVHAQWEAETIPHVVQIPGFSALGKTFDVHFQTFDDENDPARRITVITMGNDVTISIPCFLELSDITGTPPVPPSPLAVVARLELTTQLDVQPGRVRADLSTATVVVADLQRGPGEGGDNYDAVAVFVGPLLTAQLQARATAVAQAIGVISVDVPTVAEIEAFIADQLHARVAAQPDIGLWTPDLTTGDVNVTDARPNVLANVVAIAINARPGADVNQIDEFIPAGAGFAVALLGAKVIEIIDAQVAKSEDDGGLGGIPQTREIEGKQVEIDRLDFSLRTGAIRGEGDVTVIDAVAGSIDVDASFWADIGLAWQDEADGTQTIQPSVIDEDVDLSAGAWIVMIILGFIFGGLIIGVILLVVYLVVEGLAESIGSSIIHDDTTGQVKSVGAWPTTLDGIGEIESRFQNPVIIEPGAIVFSGSILVTSMYALTASAPPNTNGPYFAIARQPVHFSGGVPVPAAAYDWRFGDGAAAVGVDADHEYSHSGTYVGRLGTAVGQPGGVTLGNLTRVKVRNVPASISLTAPTTVEEGQEFEIIVDFTDPEWLDTHEVIVGFGDDTLPAVPPVTETNTEPEAVGRAVAGHAYCDNGTYTIRVQVIDNNGGVAEAVHQIVVTNVPPVVRAPERMFAYPCSPLTLIAPFTDAGWCDTHTATWDFGDCSPVVDAEVRQHHQPPQGVGYAAATHVYQGCGRFEAVVTVRDDDGATVRDSTVVHVVDVANGAFEHGFRVLPVGEVANGWFPVGTGQFRADHSVLHDGRAAQAIRVRDGSAGIGQRIGANPGWDYQITAHCHAPTGGTEMAVGVDPMGGDDPDAPAVVWTSATPTSLWRPTSVRATAEADAITVFVLVSGSERDDGRGAVGYVDGVSMVPTPCPLPEIVLPERPEEPTRTCIDWEAEKTPQQLGEETVRDDVVFQAVAGSLLLVELVPGTPGLMLPGRGLVVHFPEPAGEIVVTFIALSPGETRVVAFDDNGDATASTTATDDGGFVRTAALDAAGGTRLAILSRISDETTLVELCWEPLGTVSTVPGRPTHGIAGVVPHPVTHVPNPTDDEQRRAAHSMTPSNLRRN